MDYKFKPLHVRGAYICAQTTAGNPAEIRANRYEESVEWLIRVRELRVALIVLVYCEQMFLFGKGRVNKLFKKLVEAEKLLIP